MPGPLIRFRAFVGRLSPVLARELRTARAAAGDGVGALVGESAGRRLVILDAEDWASLHGTSRARAAAVPNDNSARVEGNDDASE